MDDRLFSKVVYTRLSFVNFPTNSFTYLYVCKLINIRTHLTKSVLYQDLTALYHHFQTRVEFYINYASM